MTIYIIRCAITLTLLYSFYGLLLRRETFHRLNRAILLSILSLTTVLPLCRVETSRENILAQKVESITAENLDVLKIAGTTGGEMQIQARGPVEFSYEMSFPWGRILSTVYFAVVICLILRYLLSMFSLARLIRHSEHFERRGKHQNPRQPEPKKFVQLDTMDSPAARTRHSRRPHDSLP